MKSAGAAEASIDDLDEIVSGEPKHQPHLVSFSDHPAVLEQDWQKTQTIGAVEIPEAVSLLISVRSCPGIRMLIATDHAACFYQKVSHPRLQRNSRVTIRPKGLGRSGRHHGKPGVLSWQSQMLTKRCYSPTH